MMPRVLSYCTLILWLAAVPAARAAMPDIDQQRRDYMAAQDALKAKNLTSYRQLHEKLDGYILRGYLEYEYLNDRLASATPEVLSDFLARNQDASVSDHLRKKWLDQLADRKDWSNFFKHYRNVDDSSALNCRRLDHLLQASDEQSQLMAEITNLWLTGSRLPSTCNAVFNAWRKAGHMTSDLVWERIQLAMERRNISLAQELGNYLDSRERVWVQRWVEMHRSPESSLRSISYPVETPVARQVVRYGVVRMSYRDPREAILMWDSLKRRYEFFGEDDNYVLRHLGILAAQNHLPEAVDWLSAVSVDARDENLRQWRVRAALRAGEWKTGLRFITALTEEEQNTNEWRYWKARLLEKTGNSKAAAPLYTQLSKERSYYGFLAADRINTPYDMQHVSIEASPEEVSAMLAQPGIQMAKELFTIGDTLSARRQWSWATRQMNNRQLQVAAVIARHWGWYDRAILTVGKSDHLDDLELRFPVLYRDIVEENAQHNKIDPSWVYGVMRQESAFVSDARSPAGALGLMQLMPQTGRMTGRKINLPIHGSGAILDIENNLRLGASYLRTVLDVNKGHEILATASYNAGPHRVKSWLPQKDELDADAWVDTIPYTETRNYVKNVMGFTMVYGHRLDVSTERLQNRMRRVDAVN